MVHLQVTKGYKKRSSHFIMIYALALIGTAANEKISQVKKVHDCALAWMSLARASSFMRSQNTQLGFHSSSDPEHSSSDLGQPSSNLG